ncbi:Transcription factor AP-4 (Activating enhancer binding protein 4), partial [Cichlidogyrus casuarinus]
MVSGIINTSVECDKRVRREIANSNERRRMQSINSGFEELKVLLPSMSESDKLSKANILKLTAKYINNLVSRINYLENEVATIRGSETFDSNPSENVRKRKLNEKRTISSKKLAEHREMSPRRTTLVLQQDSPHLSPSMMPHLSPISSAPSFCNDFQNSPGSSDCSNSARLEHLVMAIEKIEGDFDKCSTEDLTNQSSIDSEFSQISESNSFRSQTVKIRSSRKLGQKQILVNCNSPLPDDVESAKNIHASMTPITGYPTVAKMLSQGAIPHKYLHRPQ